MCRSRFLTPILLGFTALIADLLAPHFRCRGQACAVQCLEWEVEQLKRQQWFRQCHRGSVHGNASAARQGVVGGPMGSHGSALSPEDRSVKDGNCSTDPRWKSWAKAWGFICSEKTQILSTSTWVGWWGSMKPLLMAAPWCWLSPGRIQIKTECPDPGANPPS